MQKHLFPLLFLALPLMGCDAIDPFERSIGYQTENVYFEGNVPFDRDMAVSYAAYDQSGRSMSYIVELHPETSAQGRVAARVFLPTTMDSLRSACVFSFSHSEPDLTFYLEFDSDGSLQGDSVFVIPYPDGADVSEPSHRVHFQDVVRAPGSPTTVSANRQDGSESEEARLEQRRLREEGNVNAQTHHLYFSGSVTHFSSFSFPYMAYDQSGERFTYLMNFVCGRSRCRNGNTFVGLLMPQTIDSINALPGTFPGHDDLTYDLTFTLEFDDEGGIRGDSLIEVPFPPGADADPNFHTLHLGDLTRDSSWELPGVCRQDGSTNWD